MCAAGAFLRQQIMFVKANFVLQETNAQGLGTRLVLYIYFSISVSILGISVVSNYASDFTSYTTRTLAGKNYIYYYIRKIYSAAAFCIIELAKVSRTVLMLMYCDVDTEFVVLFTFGRTVTGATHNK